MNLLLVKPKKGVSTKKSFGMLDLNTAVHPNILNMKKAIEDNDYHGVVESLANTLGTIKNVWFYGPSYNEEELSNILYNADLCVAPGNIGLTAMHAMVYGCPCISHNDFKWQMPEFEAIKDGVTGTFFERDNINSLADSIENWLKNFDRNKVRLSCFKEIDEEWNPHKQLDIIKKAINDV